MTFPLFASLTTISSPLWDTAYSQLNLQSLYPCTVAGTNAITLTGSANAPAISAYANYQSFLGVVAVTNTGATTAAFGSLPALNVYKDTAAGPALLTGGELFAGNQFTLTYDGALNTGAGGFHLTTGPAALAGAYLPIAGGTITGALRVNGAFTAASVATITGVLTAGTINASGAVSVGSLLTGGSASVGTLTVATGTPATRLLSTVASITWTAILPNASQDQTIALAGASVNDLVMIGPPTSISSGIVFSGYVSAASVVSVRAGNVTTGTVTPAGASYRVGVIGFT